MIWAMFVQNLELPPPWWPRLPQHTVAGRWRRPPFADHPTPRTWPSVRSPPDPPRPEFRRIFSGWINGINNPPKKIVTRMECIEWFTIQMRSCNCKISSIFFRGMTINISLGKSCLYGLMMFDACGSIIQASRPACPPIQGWHQRDGWGELLALRICHRAQNLNLRTSGAMSCHGMQTWSESTEVDPSWEVLIRGLTGWEWLPHWPCSLQILIIFEHANIIKTLHNSPCSYSWQRIQ